MVRQKSEAYEIAEAFETVCKQFSIRLPDNSIKIPECNHIELYEFKFPVRG